MRRLLVVGIIMLVLVGGGYLALRATAGDGPVETMAVTRGPLASTIELAGTVAARATRTLAFGTAGTVASVEVEESATVAAGDLLATLDATTQEAQLAAAEAALASAEAAIRSAESRLEADRDANAPRAIRQADRAQLAAAEAQAATARSQIAAAEQAVGLTELRSPIAGTVVTLGLAVGDRVVGGAGGASGAGSSAPGSIVVADLSDLRVETTASEIDVVDLVDGQAVTLTFDALPEVELAATICEVAAAGRDSGGVVEFSILVCPSRDEARLRAGMSANVSIVLASVEDALVVPSQAVRVVNGSPSVRVLDADGTIRTMPIEIGISSETRTQVLSGLVEGDRVVVGEPDAGAG